MNNEQSVLENGKDTGALISIENQISGEIPTKNGDIKKKRGRPKLPPLSQRQKCKYVHRLAPGEGKKRGRKPKNVQKLILSTPSKNQMVPTLPLVEGPNNLIKSSFSSSSENQSSSSNPATAAVIETPVSTPPILTPTLSTGAPSNN